MTGTGIQTDPYIIMTADDLYEIEKVGSRETYFRLGADIDFNETDYALNFKPITLLFREIDGDGHAIRNIRRITEDASAYVFILSTAALSGDSPTIKNLSLENVYLSGLRTYLFFSLDTVTGSLDLVNFSASASFNPVETMTNRGYVYSLINGSERIFNCELCSFNFTANTKENVPVCAGGTMKRSQIVLDYRCVQTNSSSEQALFSNIIVNDTYVFGKISSWSGENIGNILFAANSTASNMYQVVEYSGFSGVEWNSTFGGTCFYDKDVAGDVVIRSTLSTGSPQLLYGLTTEQCKSVSYLKSIGFVVEGEE